MVALLESDLAVLFPSYSTRMASQLVLSPPHCRNASIHAHPMPSWANIRDNLSPTGARQSEPVVTTRMNPSSFYRRSGLIHLSAGGATNFELFCVSRPT